MNRILKQKKLFLLDYNFAFLKSYTYQLSQVIFNYMLGRPKAQPFEGLCTIFTYTSFNHYTSVCSTLSVPYDEIGTIASFHPKYGIGRVTCMSYWLCMFDPYIILRRRESVVLIFELQFSSSLQKCMQSAADIVWVIQKLFSKLISERNLNKKILKFSLLVCTSIDCQFRMAQSYFESIIFLIIFIASLRLTYPFISFKFHLHYLNL